MTPLFENKTVITKEVLKEFSSEAFKIHSKMYRTLVFLAFFISGILAVLTLITEGLSFISALLFLASLFFLFIFFKGYIVKLNQNYKSFQKLYGELPEVVVSFYDEKIEVVTKRSNLTLDYNQLTGIHETETLYLLIIDKYSTTISKNGFTIGNLDNFKEFIKDKCKELSVNLKD